MGKEKDEYPAYPTEGPFEIYSGIPIRTVIAKDIMAAIVSNLESPAPDWSECAIDAVKATNALIEELTKDGKSL